MLPKKKPGRPIQPPPSLLFKPVKLDLKGLFKSLTEAAVAGWTGKYTEAGGKLLAGLVGMVTLEKMTAAQAAYVLIRRALTRSVVGLASEFRLLEGVTASALLADINNDLDRAIESEEITLSKDFFQDPGGLALLSRVMHLLRRWLRAGGFDDRRADEFAALLPSWFVRALDEELRDHREKYAALEKLTTPFTPASDTEAAWLDYHTWLQLQADPLLFDENLTLDAVYVDLRAYYEKRPGAVAGRPIDEPRVGAKLERVAGWLREMVAAWLENPSEDDAIRILSGGPGSGKSVSARRVAAAVTRGEFLSGRWRVIYIPLHRFDLKSNLAESLQAHCRNHPLLGIDLFTGSHDSERYFIVFDGLDELSKQGQSGQELAGDFFGQVQRFVEVQNQAGVRVMVLLSGRPVAVAFSKAEDRNREHVFHLLPYLMSDKRRVEAEYTDIDGLLAEDQRDAWWQKYGAAIGEEWTAMPGDLKKLQALEPITAEPLLNYLVALALKAGSTFNEETNRNSIYADLFRQVWDRRYDKGISRPPGLTIEKFHRLLEEIALAAWHGGETRATNRKAIHRRCEQAGVLRTLDEIFPKPAAAGSAAKEAHAGITSLLMAFYFRADSGGDDAAFEFTHKSFGEYLLACRLIRVLRTLRSDQAHAEQQESNWSVASALAEWARVMGPTRMDQDLALFISDGLKLADQAEVASWQRLLVRLINYQQRHGLPMETLGLATFAEMNDQARHSEAALLVFTGKCAELTGEISDVSWPETTSFRDWLHRLNTGGQEEFGLVKQSLNLLNLREADLRCEDLRYVSLRGADLSGADLGSTNLTGAELRDAVLCGAILDGAVLVEADLRWADIEGGSLSQTQLRGADFHEANVDNVDIFLADLTDANLTREQLKRTTSSPLYLVNGKKPRKQ